MDRDNLLDVQNRLAPISRQAAAEGIVLLKNDEAVLPIKHSDNLAVFGRCQLDTYRSGTGSGGAVNVRYAVSIIKGFQDNDTIHLNENLAERYRQWVKENPFDDGGGGWAAEPWYQEEMLLSDEDVALASTESNKAVFIVGRTAGEDQDNADLPGSYKMTDIEMSMLKKVTQHFSEVIVVMNTTNVMDMSWLVTLENRHVIKSVLYCWASGMEGGHALADVLSGNISPSGKMTDTIAYDLCEYPSSANFGRSDYNCYAEDIYVGYRYFETFKPSAVQFEFGFGLSYTRFQQDLVGFDIVGQVQNSVVRVSVKVTNIGELYAGKDVVQVYLEAPQGKLGKPARSLVGFVKTSELNPGASETHTISIPARDLASYDDSGVTGHKSCYVLEPGDYYFHIGASVRDTAKLAHRYHVSSLIVTQECQEALAPSRSFERMKPKGCSDGQYDVAFEPVPQRSVSLLDRIESNLPQELAITGDIGVKLQDVKSGEAALDQFVAQLSLPQLATIVRGEGMCSPKVAPGTAAAFGGISDDLTDFGIPAVAAADGPSGIRMDSGHQATQVPIGTLLGCTWNPQLNEQLFYWIGKELCAYQIDTLLGPGINIHRHPLNGRNFEYFSEDPYLTGTIAVAQVSGLKQASVTGTLKHFAANDQETGRMDVDSVMSERAIREVHIKPFEMAVKYGGATTIMTCYNPVNGHWGASNYDLNTSVLRNEWGFKGIVMTDWWAKMNHPVDGGGEDKVHTSYMIRAQNDLYMVVDNDGAATNVAGDDTLTAIEQGTLTLGELQRSVMNICRFILDSPAMDRPVERYKAVKAVNPFHEYFGSNAITVDAIPPLNTNSNTSFVIEVATPATYQIAASMSYDRPSLAQSSCALSLNDEFCMSLSVHGTDGELVNIEGSKLYLVQGYYHVCIDFVKAGATVHELELRKC
ncbi:glycoside hydrolase family 3 C-terminal domain-containing protein [Vibrio sp. Sgm 22]|uniref:glycoside hydrolase family 3 protein n=1 Tax=unclassified Vibrio TaxID=2614977 RepID=UPI0022498C47|nr:MULTISPECIES: glycoside hydrolase family 3 protein [unclassified Vibrio]MCX2758306.1 glycoside hydrolase family 3 C-terminal domain-containing protein [Vibrio sp. 14G-20]MCX2775733.1 glycoside hydrolase family 3 C-terminal domain-containing protein [Vibrio sp. Sgm 22]